MFDKPMSCHFFLYLIGDPSEQGRMNLAMAIGISITLTSLLLLIAGLALYCRRNKGYRASQRCRLPRLIPTQHGEYDVVLEMEPTRSQNENQPLSQLPPATADDQQYNGPETAPDLNKDNQADPSLLC
jgi:hypothetical protein